MEAKKIKGLLAIPVLIGAMMVAGLFALLPNAVSAESPRAATAVLWEEDFETDGNGSRYTPSEVCSDGLGDYFTRTNGTDVSGTYNSPNGSYFWAAMDTNGTPCLSASQSITFQTFAITDVTDFLFTGLFAEDDDGSNQDWDANDRVSVEYQVDGGAWIEILRFEAVGGTNTEPAEDTDFDGLGDGVRLTDTFTDFTKSFVASGSMMTVAIRVEGLDNGDEDIAFDYLRVEEDVPTTLWVEDFETDGNGSRYTPSEVCSDGSGDYFTRTNGSDHGGFVVYNSPNGSYYWAGMDTDSAPCTSASQEIVFQSFDITGYENLVFRGLFAEDDDGSNQDWDADTSVYVEYQVDGGAWIEILRFEAVGGTNTEPAEDTDFDGLGDGAYLTDTFAEFAKSIVTSGSMMTVAIRTENLGAGDEDIAFDYLRIEEGTIAVDELSLSKSVSPESAVFPGDLVTYTLLLESTGEESTAALTDTLPAENEFAYWIEQPAGAAVTADQVAWTGSISSTQPITISFVVTNTASSETITNTAVYSGSGEMGSAEAVYTAVAEPSADGLVCFAESFEESPGTIYTLSAAFDDGSHDFFGRYAVPDLSNASRDDFTTGWTEAMALWGKTTMVTVKL